MARSRTIDPETTPEQASTKIGDELDAGFGAEFRELARQRRFVRSSDDQHEPGAVVPAEHPAASRANWRDEAAPPSGRARAVPTPEPRASTGSPATSPVRARTPAATTAPARASTSEPAVPMPATAASATANAARGAAPEGFTRATSRAAAAAAAVAPHTVNPLERLSVPRLSNDQRATLMELARMSDRLVDSREQVAAAVTHVSVLEQELDSARTRLSAADDRLMASSVLVRDAQRATHELSERAAWLEGRNEMLQEALELAVNASVVTRWKWRREQRARRA